MKKSLNYQDRPIPLAAMSQLLLLFNPGETPAAYAKEFGVFPVSTGLNVATNFRRLSGSKAKTMIFSRVVEDMFGVPLYQAASETGVCLDWVKRVEAKANLRTATMMLGRGYGHRPPEPAKFDRYADPMAKLTLAQAKKIWNLDTILPQVGILHMGAHLGGLSKHMPEILEFLLDKAKAHGVLTAVDLNYRGAMFNERKDQWRELAIRLAGRADILIGNGEFMQHDLQLEDRCLATVTSKFPNVKLLAQTKRKDLGSANEYGAAMLLGGKTWEVSQEKYDVLRAIGTGDAFNAGLYWMIHSGETDGQEALEFAVACGAHCMTTDGDHLMINSAADVRRTRAMR